MPLIAYREKRIKESLNIEIVHDINEQIKKYCEWSGVTDLAFFIEEAAKHVFSDDKQWIKYQQGKK